MNKLKLAGFIFPLIGFIVLVAGLYHLGHGAYAKITYVPVEATLTSYDTHRDSDGDVRYLPKVTYTYEGHTYQDQSYSVQSNEPAIGRKLTCLCNPKDPSKLADPGDDFLLGGILSFMGAIFFFLGMIPLSTALGESPFAWISKHIFRKNKKKKTKQHSASTIFLIFGIAGVGMFLLGTYLLTQGVRTKQNADPVSALITEIDSHRNADGDTQHTVYICYTYNGKTYDNVRLNSWTSGMKKGKTITVYCTPEYPGSPDIPSVDFFMSALLLFMAIIFSLVGFGNIISQSKRNKRQQNIYENGIRIQAKVDAIELDYSLTVNGMHPFIIHCTYKDESTNEMHEFVSSQFWEDPEMVFPLDSEIDVYVDPNDYSNYYVDAVEKMVSFYNL